MSSLEWVGDSVVEGQVVEQEFVVQAGNCSGTGAADTSGSPAL